MAFWRSQAAHVHFRSLAHREREQKMEMIKTHDVHWDPKLFDKMSEEDQESILNKCVKCGEEKIELARQRTEFVKHALKLAGTLFRGLNKKM